MAHTKGPWRVRERSGYYEILAASPDCDWYGEPKTHAVAYADTEIEESEQIANAHLIAASPDLLAAAEMLASLQSDDNGRSFPTAEQCAFAKRAIAKATGATDA